MRGISFQCSEDRTKRSPLRIPHLALRGSFAEKSEWMVRKKERKKRKSWKRVAHPRNVRKVVPRYLCNCSPRTHYRKIPVIMWLFFNSWCDYTVKRILVSSSISTVKNAYRRISLMYILTLIPMWIVIFPLKHQETELPSGFSLSFPAY